ncbi:MAG: hypothetical protein CSA62_01120 [Planctomycetota bacterium]|nr:MAG: hypothetical protein CSA62_01120 [Planctomycetota bacterium]
MKLALWLLAATASLQVILLFAGLLPPAWCETWHGRGVFPLLRSVLGGLANLLPFSLAQLLLILGLLLLLAAVTELGLRWAGKLELLRLGPWALLMLLLLIHGLLLGYGWLHAQAGLAKRLHLAQPSAKQVETRARALAQQAAALHSAAPKQDWDWRELESLAHEAVRKACAELDWPPPTRLHLKIPWPRRFLMRFGVSGVFSPFTFEPHVDAGLHPAELPFVACHELAHLAGIASESEANFFAWIACSLSPDPRFQLAAKLGVLGYFESNLQDLRAELHKLQGEAVLAIRRAIQNRWRQSIWEPAQKAQRWSYDRFLRAHGVTSGIRSYDLVTRLIAAWPQD